MAKPDTVTVPSSVPSAKSDPVGFSVSTPARLADDARALLAMWRAAMEEKGDKRARSVHNVRTLAACVVADVTRDSAMAGAARGTRIGVEVKSRLRGEATTAAQSLPVLDVLHALCFGGLVQGGGRLV